MTKNTYFDSILPILKTIIKLENELSSILYPYTNVILPHITAMINAENEYFLNLDLNYDNLKVNIIKLLLLRNTDYQEVYDSLATLIDVLEDEDDILQIKKEGLDGASNRIESIKENFYSLKLLTTPEEVRNMIMDVKAQLENELTI